MHPPTFCWTARASRHRQILLPETAPALRRLWEELT
ncbi:hypothetical protein R2601_03418 [Salipiger bermudensis HTCC2601]|uniref:Uncharacterized protein n=1 Tax=Salipiger bermudensis (strain DSM 26914 / JCM 13377 / KCTC 12554 / HTCC2601) TaxID=314265 RepID=Q0FWG2_SALBH|nr:hypothetical protein R2601_03418 [Salipiger bermudensis HTCC2601]